jgi:haloalkane dehalogenase
MTAASLVAPSVSPPAAPADGSVPPWLDRDAYPFAWHAAPTTFGSMHYVDEGQGDPILFVHGTPTWSFEWRHAIKALSATHRCIAPDLLGFGLSDRPERFAYTPEAHAEVLAEFVRSLDLRDFTLVVHDFGGPIGLPLALTADSRVRRVVLINTWMWPFDDPAMRRKARIAGGAVGRWLYRQLNFSQRVLMPSVYGDRTRLTADIHRQYLAVFTDKDARVRVLHALARALEGSREYYARLWGQVDRLRNRPVSIIWGMKDSAFGPDQLAKWRAALPHARVTEIPGAGHWPHEEAPDAVIAALRTSV